MRNLLAVAALVVVAPLGAAQFSQFEWILHNGTGCLVIESEDQVIFGGGNNLAAFTTYATQLDFDALVTFHITTIATPKGDCGDSHAIFGTPGNLTSWPDCSSGQLTYFVTAHDWIVIGHDIVDNTAPGDSIFSGLVVTPFWVNLAGTLAGAAGEPRLAGKGVPYPGHIVQLLVSAAAPAAPTALVIGLTEVGLPFKGGVLVPAPDVILPGLVTDFAGNLVLAGTWPPLPALLPVFFQAWIEDAGGPQGFAATNAVQVFSY